MPRIALLVTASVLAAGVVTGVTGCATTSKLASSSSSAPIVDSGSPTSTLPSAPPSTSAAQGSTLSSDNSFSVVLPTDWTLTTAASGQVLAARAASATDNVTDTLTILSSSPTTMPALPDVAASGELQTRQHGGTVASLSPRTIGGEPAVGYSVDRTKDGVDVTQLQWFAIHGDKIVTVTTTAAASQKSALTELTGALLDSWAWTS